LRRSAPTNPAPKPFEKIGCMRADLHIGGLRAADYVASTPVSHGRRFDM
jgi:hypothetical protein